MFFQDLFQLSISSHDFKKTTNLINQTQKESYRLFRFFLVFLVTNNWSQRTQRRHKGHEVYFSFAPLREIFIKHQDTKSQRNTKLLSRNSLVKQLFPLKDQFYLTNLFPPDQHISWQMTNGPLFLY